MNVHSYPIFMSCFQIFTGDHHLVWFVCWTVPNCLAVCCRASFGIVGCCCWRCCCCCCCFSVYFLYVFALFVWFFGALDSWREGSLTLHHNQLLLIVRFCEKVVSVVNRCLFIYCLILNCPWNKIGRAVRMWPTFQTFALPSEFESSFDVTVNYSPISQFRILTFVNNFTSVATRF